jgi:hypothetical protein
MTRKPEVGCCIKTYYAPPNINTIIVQGGPGSACPDPTRTCEIGDVCSSFALVGGMQVQSYWSKGRQPLCHPADHHQWRDDREPGIDSGAIPASGEL